MMPCLRLGLIIPSVNVVIERDLRDFLPEHVDAHVTRISLVGTGAAALTAALAAAPDAATLLAHAGVTAVALACTGASMMAEAGEASAASRLEAATGLPAIDTMGALFAAFTALGVRRVTLVSPFDDAFNAAEARALAAGGVTVQNTVGFAAADPRSCPAFDPDDIIDRAAAADGPRSEAIFLSCANLRGFEAVERLEQVTGKPVVTSNQAVLWALLRLGGDAAAVPGGGRLFHTDMEFHR